MATLGGPILQKETDLYGEWVKIFRHRSTDNVFYSSGNNWAEAKQTNTSTPNADKYSILTTWGKFLRNEKYTLKLNYPVNGVVNIWSQTNNPVIETNTNSGTTDYTAISIDNTSSGWAGLERSSTSTFLDGSVNSGSWWWAIGSKNNYDTGNPNYPGPGSVTELCELWILHKPA